MNYVLYTHDVTCDLRRWKCESLFYKINAFLQKKLPFALGCKQANILSKYIVYIFFNFGRGLCGSFPLLFPKAPASCCKETLK